MTLYQCTGKCSKNNCKFEYILDTPEYDCYHKAMHKLTHNCNRYPQCIIVDEFIKKEEMEIK